MCEKVCVNRPGGTEFRSELARRLQCAGHLCLRQAASSSCCRAEEKEEAWNKTKMISLALLHLLSTVSSTLL